MEIINFNPSVHSYNKETGVFTVSEKDVKFATEYKIYNPNTKKGHVFEFTHSTGPEFAVDTKWVYKCKDMPELSLEVCNDADMVKAAAKAYLEAKTRKL